MHVTARILIAALVVVMGVVWYVSRPYAYGSEPVGTAGPLRSWGWTDCGKSSSEQRAGACDPAPVAAGLAGEERMQARLTRAVKLLSLARLKQAEDELSVAVADDPKDLRPLKLRARVYLTEEKYALAWADFRAGLLAAPADLYLLANLAYMELGTPGRALPIINRVIAAWPDSADPLWVRARIYESMANNDAAAADLDHALRVEPGEMRLLLERARLGLRRGTYDEVIADTTVLLSTIARASAYRYRGMAKTALKDYPGALDDITRSLHEGREWGSQVVGLMNDAAMLRVMLLVRLDRKEEARQYLAAIVQNGGQRMILKMQLGLRRAGAEVALDGKWSAGLETALYACFLDNACAGATVEKQT